MAPPPAERSTSKKLNRVDPTKPIFKCWHCDFETNWRPSLSKHKRTHIPVKAFKCFACDYRSVRRDTLLIHFRAHTGIRPYACNVCDFKCSLKTTLKVHKKTHTKIRSFKCSMCEKVFVKSCFMMFHEKRHMRECPNTCNVPECTCKNKDNARLKPFPCALCPYRYACLGNLTLHKKIHEESQNANLDESCSESEPENAENMSKFYAEFDKKELSELELPSSMYQQLIDEESLCSLSQFTLHKKKEKKSQKANDSKDKTKEEPAASSEKTSTESPNAKKSKNETEKNVTVVSAIIKNKSMNIKNSKDKSEQNLNAVKKIIKVKSVNVKTSKEKKEQNLYAVKKKIKVKSLNVNNSKEKKEQNLNAVKKIIKVKSLNVNNSKNKTEKKLTVVNKIIHSKSINVKNAKNKTEKNLAASKKFIEMKSLNVKNSKDKTGKNWTASKKHIQIKSHNFNSSKTTAEEPQNAENESSTYKDFDQSELFESVLPSSFQEFHNITHNEFLNTNNLIDNTEEPLFQFENEKNMSSAYSEFDQRELSESALPPFYQEFLKKGHNKSPNANNSKDSPEQHLTELKNVENLSSVYTEFDQNKLSELTLPPFYQEFHKITPNKSVNANNLKDDQEEQLIELNNVENLSPFNAEFDQNKLELPPFYQEFQIITPNKSVNPNNSSDKLGEQLTDLKTVEKSSSLHVELDKNKQSEVVLPPFYQEFRKLTPNKCLNAKNSKTIAVENTTVLKNAENLTTLHVELDKSKQSELVLPPFYQEFRKLTPNKSLNAKISKTITVENSESMSSFYDRFDQNELSELTLAPSMYQQLVDEQCLSSVSCDSIIVNNN